MAVVRCRRSEIGASAVEYALIVALIAVVVTGAVSTLGASLFADDVEVLGHVLERGELPPGEQIAPVADVPAPPAGGGNCGNGKGRGTHNPQCPP